MEELNKKNKKIILKKIIADLTRSSKSLLKNNTYIGNRFICLSIHDIMEYEIYDESDMCTWFPELYNMIKNHSLTEFVIFTPKEIYVKYKKGDEKYAETMYRLELLNELLNELNVKN